MGMLDSEKNPNLERFFMKFFLKFFHIRNESLLFVQKMHGGRENDRQNGRKMKRAAS